jgi:PPK2 family polyphosphate:nucleotide phosphotransferase
MPERQRWLVNKRFDLAAVDPASTAGAPGDKEATTATFEADWERLGDLQTRLWAAGDRSLLLVLQAMDTGGKDGTVKHLYRGLNPIGVHVVPFKAPTEEELARDFLWRVHADVPRDGQLTIFNRSHYEDVLIVRVHGLVAEDTWRARYEHIRAFERLLVAGGTTVVKVMLHISPDEQLERLRARLEDPTKRWKFNPDDVDERKRWDEYMAAYADALAETSTADAPWYCVPADRKWYRNWAVTQILLETLEDLDPQYPDPPDLSGVKL